MVLLGSDPVLLPAELPPDGLPPGHLHHRHVGPQAGLDHRFRGEQVCPELDVCPCPLLTACLPPPGVSEQRGLPAPVRGSDRGSAQPADPVWLGPLLDPGQPVPEPLSAQPAVPGIPVSPDRVRAGAGGGSGSEPVTPRLMFLCSVTVCEA